MGYIHYNCGGKISFWGRKCKKCGKQWPISAWGGSKPPDDMYFEVTERIVPRWVKVAFRLALIVVAAFILVSLVTFFGVGLTGIVGLLLVTAFIFLITFLSKRKNKRG